MTELFDSGVLDFSGDENTPVAVNHNLGVCPKSIQFLGVSGSDEGFVTVLDGNGDELPAPYLEQTRHENQLLVYCPDVYPMTQFRIRIYG
jgi:hypothetical protein